MAQFFIPDLKRKDMDDGDDEKKPPDMKRNKKDCEGAAQGNAQGNAGLRRRIIALSKSNPALSASIGISWFRALSDEFEKDYFKELGEFLRIEQTKYTVYPPEHEVYFWTRTMQIQDVKVVILDEEPHHRRYQANGLAFSVRSGMFCPPSLQNIFRELSTDIPGFTTPENGNLYGWATQGVLLLNTTLTVRANCPNSHKDAKWNQLTDAVIRWISENLIHTVFMLWGKNAQEKLSLILQERHLILTAPHPSPFSADQGFFGCRHFSKANEYLEAHGKKPIDWNHLPIMKF